ncbi:MAG TPA: isoprenylcysteine carboxyl methyltransferase family protein [Actinomycetes bacterium]|nr:isoprenylcysteine carboxyl methyltransferase family protein [Actinomycetes bacterium]
MNSTGWYLLLIAAVACERLVELVVSKRHIDWAREHGATERGFGHYPFMVSLHVGLLVGCAAEVWFLQPPFYPWLGWPMLGLVLLAQALRWWCIRTLGPHWNTRVVVVPGTTLVDRGPYRWMSHPNYVAVVIEGIALPLVHTAWITAVIFTFANALLLRVRIVTENEALRELTTPNHKDAVSP